MSKIDLDVIGKMTEARVFEYSWRDVVLYALGVGATAEELSLVYENAPGGLKVLPSFCVVPTVRAFPSFGDDKEFKARFTSEVYPGDTLSTEGWKTDDGYIIQARTDSAVVLSNARAIID
jgi:hypothetical protein